MISCLSSVFGARFAKFRAWSSLQRPHASTKTHTRQRGPDKFRGFRKAARTVPMFLQVSTRTPHFPRPPEAPPRKSGGYPGNFPCSSRYPPSGGSRLRRKQMGGIDSAHGRLKYPPRWCPPSGKYPPRQPDGLPWCQEAHAEGAYCLHRPAGHRRPAPREGVQDSGGGVRVVRVAPPGPPIGRYAGEAAKDCSGTRGIKQARVVWVARACPPAFCPGGSRLYAARATRARYDLRAISPSPLCDAH